MAISPKKHRGPHPINTLSSPQKPVFHTTSTRRGFTETVTHIDGSPRYPLSVSDGNNSFSESCLDYSSRDRPGIEFLGDSSSLFENDQVQNIYTSRPWISEIEDTVNVSNTGRMAKEREPQAGSPRTDSVVPKALQDLTNTPPEFGKASPLRNPLHKESKKTAYSNLFNVPKSNQARVEHHRAPPQQPSAQTLPQYTHHGDGLVGQGHQHISSQPPKSTQPPGNAGAGLPHSFKQRPLQGGPRHNTSFTGSDIVEISATEFQPKQMNQGFQVSRPVNLAPRTIQPAPRPVYSAMGQAPSFQPINNNFNPFNPHGSRQTTIIQDPSLKRHDNSDDDEFDPDTAIRAEGNRFGAPDPYAYVDTSRANENIKHLLEGALEDDEEKIPRTRGRKKKKQAQEEQKKSLAEKLASLDVQEDKKTTSDNEDEGEEDDGTVEGLKVKLLPHQVDGVAWMIEKETGAHMKRVPPKGGLLADDMGLGKTIQSLALVLSNPRPEKGDEPENKKNKILDSVGKGTLIVAPLALIRQWESEINTKVTKAHSLKVLVHHGPRRTESIKKLKEQDVVITTYQVLSSEHGKCGEGPDGLKKGCFAVHWYRVILDEAHTIKNRLAKMTKACYELRSHYRWCLTGTPMQNNLDELQSLIKFLSIKPYCDMASWKDSIIDPMKNGRGNLAIRRLQICLKTFMKRRTKDVLKKEGALNFGGKNQAAKNNDGFQIVARNVETVIGSFTAKERAFYDRLSDRAQARIDEMMGGEKTDYIGALVLLLRLRQACNHPKLTKSNVKDDKDALTTGQKSSVQSGTQTPQKSKDTDADDLADLLGGLSVQTKRCDICQNLITRDNATAGAIRCNDCEDDLNTSQKKTKEHKKHRKHKHKDHKHKKGKKIKDESDDESVQPSKNSRQRRVIVDSDDEDAEGGEWIVPKDQQDTSNLGKAGGFDDEDEEGGGDTLGSVDSDSFASGHEGTPSKKKHEDSFIIHDTDSEDDGTVFKRKLQKNTKVINLVSDDEADSDTESATDSDSDETDSEASESETPDSPVEYDASDLTPSTKIRQLLSILEKETPEHKVIVFSQFTSMLDLIEPFLQRGGYNFTRYDGSMRNDLREASLHKLRNDKRTRVLLCSLKCGSLGLNLTAASRVVIMEPFWNPFVEEQAIDRVHRLNQTVDVTVYRLSIHNSVEERIMELQEAKRQLAEATLEGGKAMGKLTMQDMLALFKRDAEYDPRHIDHPADGALFSQGRVLHDSVNGLRTMIDSQGTSESVVKRKAGSLGLKRVEHSVWGRR